MQDSCRSRDYRRKRASYAPPRALVPLSRSAT
jgi:hypothetical protein